MNIIARVLKQQKANNIYIIAFLQIICFFPCVSILFLDNPLEPLQANYIFKIFILSEIPKILNFQSQLILVIFVVLLSITVITILFNLTTNPFKQLVITLGYLVQFLKIFSVPILGFFLENLFHVIKYQKTIGWLAVQIVYCVSAFIVLIFTAIFTYFEIRPLRYSNCLWNYSNQKEFYHLILSYARTIIIFADGISPIFLCGSLAAELWIVSQKQVIMNPEVVIFNRLKNVLIAIVHIILLFNLIFKEQQLGFIFLCLSGSLALIMSLLDFISVKQMAQQIPECKFQKCTEMYNFYVGFWYKNKNFKEEMSKVNEHYLLCNSKTCFFTNSKQEGSSKVTDEQIEQRIANFLKSFRYSTPESELMYQIWKIQMNKSISLSHKMRKFSICHQFVIFYVLGPETTDNKKQSNGNENIGSALATNSLNFKWKYYKQLSQTVNMFEKMGEAMTKTLPQLNQIINAVIGIHVETIALNEVFEEMVKTKQVNYICVELFMKFLESFLDESKLPPEIMDRFRRIKVLKHSDAIQQNSLPCFIVESFKKTVDKVNCQALKFLKVQRYQIKDKNFTNLIIPEINLKQLEAIQNENNDKQEFIPIFFKVKSSSTTNMVCRNIKIKTVSTGNKNYFEIVVHKRNMNHSIIEILIDDDENMKGFSQNSITLSFGKQKQEKLIEDIFNENIRPLLKDITLAQVNRIDFGKGCQVTGLLIQKFCPYPKMRLISLNLVKKMNPTRNTKKMTNIRLTKIYNNKAEFDFQYYEGPNSTLTLEYSHQSKKHLGLFFNSSSQEMNHLNNHFNQIVHASINQEQKNFGAGIKAYRLYSGDLYNIDLEDKKKYEQEFLGIQIRSESERTIFQLNSTCLLICLILSSLLIIAGSIFLQIQMNSLLLTVKKQQIEFMQIEQFNLNFFRILSSLRDVANGLYSDYGRDYNFDIMDSYNDLQKMDMTEFFSYQTYVANYEGLHYRGTLCELIQVCLTYVYQFLDSHNFETIEGIHDFAILELGPKIHDQKMSKYNNIMDVKDSIQFQSFAFFLVCSIGAVFYLLFFVFIAKKKKKDLNAFLESVLTISENEIRRILQQCQKFNNVISSLYKNYEVDLQNVGSKKEETSKRIKPKKTNFGFSSIILEIALSFSLLLCFVGLSYYQYSKITFENKINEKSFIEGYSVIGVYTEIIWITNQIQHTGIIDYQKIQLISDKLTVIENNKFDYEFSEHVQKEVLEVFFEDACLDLVEEHVLDQKWCGDSLIGFEITNPFYLSLDMYFRRLQYNLIVNITDTFASTGLFSEPFKHVFVHISEKIKQEIYVSLDNSIASIFNLSIGIIFISCFMFLFIIFYMIYHRNIIKTMNEGLVTLTGGRKGEEEKKLKQEQKTKKSVKEIKNKEAAGDGEPNESLDQIAEEQSKFDKQEMNRR